MDSKDDDALQLPFLQSTEVSRFLTSSSRDWTSPPTLATTSGGGGERSVLTTDNTNATNNNNDNDNNAITVDDDNNNNTDPSGGFLRNIEDSSPIDFFGHYSASPPLMYQPSFQFSNQSDAFNGFLDEFGGPPTAASSANHSPPLSATTNTNNSYGLPPSGFNNNNQYTNQIEQQQQQTPQQYPSSFPNDNSTLPVTASSSSHHHSLTNDSNVAISTIFPSDDIKEFLEDNKFLQFLPLNLDVQLYDHRGNKTPLDINASLYGNFFLSQPTSSGSTPTATSSSPSSESNKKSLSKYELTFYRRNLFQVLVSVSNAQHATYAATDPNNPSVRSRILSLSLAVGVSGSEDKKPKQLLYCPPKTNSGTAQFSNNNNNHMKPVEQEPAIKLINPQNSGYDEVVDWKRLQFRTATAHNGRKKLQNYFSITVSLYAELENAQRVRVASVCSRPIVVRGRNPRFYQNRDNIILPDGGTNRERNLSRNHNSNSPSLSQNQSPTISAQSQQPIVKQESQPYIKLESPVFEPTTSLNPTNFDSSDYYKPSLSSQYSSMPPPQQYSTTTTTTTNNNHFQAKQPKSHDSDHVQLYPYSEKELPISGSVKYSDDDVDVKQETNNNNKYQPPRQDQQQYPDNRSSSDEKLDYDYEYFPMPLNYWLPPVEVVYRPHAVHHPLKFPRGKSQSMIDNSKRYFSAVD